MRLNTMFQHASWVSTITVGLLSPGLATAQDAQQTQPAKPAEAAAPAQPGQPAPPAVPSQNPPQQVAAASAEPVKPWTLQCSEAKDGKQPHCLITQTLGDPKTNKRLLQVSVRKEDKGVMSMIFLLPHGLHLPEGMSYQVDGGGMKRTPVQASDDKGVYAAIALDKTLMASLKRGQVLKVGVTGLDRRKTTIPVTLSGFTAAADGLK